jgi:hypothetical protein
MYILNKWTSHAHDVLKLEPDLTQDILHGLQAHAHRQANTWSSLAIGCVKLWIPFMQKNVLEIDWPESLFVHVNAALGLIDSYKPGLQHRTHCVISLIRYHMLFYLRYLLDRTTLRALIFRLTFV